jgi:hypothetical protein
MHGSLETVTAGERICARTHLCAEPSAAERGSPRGCRDLGLLSCLSAQDRLSLRSGSQ